MERERECGRSVEWSGEEMECGTGPFSLQHNMELTARIFKLAGSKIMCIDPRIGELFLF